MRKHMLALPALVALLAGSAVGVAAQDRAARSDGLVTEEVELGVERIIRDDAGHNLDEKHPTYRYDMDGIAITPDGTVWLSTTYHDTDSDANPRGRLVWALGQPGTYILVEGESPAPNTTYLYLQPDGTRILVESRVVSTEDAAFIPDVGPLSPRWGREGYWVVRSDGEDSCWATKGGTGVTCGDPSGEMTRYLSHTPINQIAIAPDGTIWAVGGHDGEDGDLYRITLD